MLLSEGIETATVVAGNLESAAELHALQEANDVSLIRDDLRLPDDGDGHESHQYNTKGQCNIGVRLGCG
jgi:hypothetical protein